MKYICHTQNSPFNVGDIAAFVVHHPNGHAKGYRIWKSSEGGWWTGGHNLDGILIAQDARSGWWFDPEASLSGFSRIPTFSVGTRVLFKPYSQYPGHFLSNSNLYWRASLGCYDKRAYGVVLRQDERTGALRIKVDEGYGQGEQAQISPFDVDAVPALKDTPSYAYGSTYLKSEPVGVKVTHAVEKRAISFYEAEEMRNMKAALEEAEKDSEDITALIEEAEEAEDFVKARSGYSSFSPSKYAKAVEEEEEEEYEEEEYDEDEMAEISKDMEKNVDDLVREAEEAEKRTVKKSWVTHAVDSERATGPVVRGVVKVKGKGKPVFVEDERKKPDFDNLAESGRVFTPRRSKRNKFRAENIL
jgi:hypothetical protein